MAIKLTTGNRIAETSSKGNQEKWREDGRWYKLDLFGYIRDRAATCIKMQQAKLER